MNYEKRLLKFLNDYPIGWRIQDIASVWKRSVVDVSNAALVLTIARKVKVKGGQLYAKSM